MRAFSDDERAAMRAIKGVGPTVIARLEALGFHRLAQLADEDAAVVTQRIARQLGTTCWRNSPQARAAIQAVIDLARRAR